MNKQEIINKLVEVHDSFILDISRLSEDGFVYGPESKWTSGQQLDHICKSISPLNKALMIPSFILKWKFGTSNRPSKAYEGLVEKYHSKLALGGTASKAFIPEKVTFKFKDNLCKTLEKSVSKLSIRVSGYSEKELDTIILPHPLLGKLTLREMMYFTIYHVQHHHNSVLKNLEQSEI